MKFIRKHGRIIPIREKGETKPHPKKPQNIHNAILRQAASKVSVPRKVLGGVEGFVVGGLAGGTAATLVGVGVEKIAPKLTRKVGLPLIGLAAAAGALAQGKWGYKSAGIGKNEYLTARREVLQRRKKR